MFKKSLAICLLICHSSWEAIPATINKCHVADSDCIMKTTTDILHRFPHGNKDLGLVDIEPIHLKELVLSENKGNTPLQLNLKFTNVEITGLSKTTITKVNGFGADPRTSKFEVHGLSPVIHLKGNYVTSGRILLLPIVGSGVAEIQLKNLRTGVKFKPTITDMNGKQHIGIDKIKVITEPEDVKINLENLFNNKQLSDEMNKILNGNWHDVWSELQIGINNGFTEIIGKLISEVFKKVTYDEFYASE